ncbi:MAG: hypothetical protein EA376_01485 [Phycisphaeraceae bacterium]|nr:MAG: hypothetical protein EA376_01485 [Phycisphaeraceae bacterium]
MMRNLPAKLLARRNRDRAGAILDKLDSADQNADALIDAYLDRELPPERSAELFKTLRSNRQAADRFDSMQKLVDDLRRPVEAPDLTASILSEVGRRRGWLPEPMRRAVTFGRLSAAACFLLLLGGLFVVDRIAPDSTPFPTGPEPITNLVSTGRAEAAAGIQNFAGVFDTLREPETVLTRRAACDADRPQRAWDSAVVLPRERSASPRRMQFIAHACSTGEDSPRAVVFRMHMNPDYTIRFESKQQESLGNEARFITVGIQSAGEAPAWARFARPAAGKQAPAGHIERE